MVTYARTPRPTLTYFFRYVSILYFILGTGLWKQYDHGICREPSECREDFESIESFGKWQNSSFNHCLVHRRIACLQLNLVHRLAMSTKQHFTFSLEMDPCILLRAQISSIQCPTLQDWSCNSPKYLAQKLRIKQKLVVLKSLDLREPYEMSISD
jgi:hypothetical protein